MPAYKPAFEIGSRVKVVGGAALETFARKWRYHNPVTREQMACAGQHARVSQVGTHHGGDPLYVLDGIPGVWHEECLLAADCPVGSV